MKLNYEVYILTIFFFNYTEVSSVAGIWNQETELTDVNLLSTELEGPVDNLNFIHFLWL